MHKLGRYWLFVWLVASPQFLSATTYFVATNGSDSYDGLYPAYLGSANGPFRTLSRAAAKVQAGDTVEIRGGTYVEKVNFMTDGTAAKRITITNYNSESVIIDGQYTLPGGSIYYYLVTVSGDYVTLSNVSIKHSSGSLLALTGDYSYAINVTGEGSRETGMCAIGTGNLFDGCLMTDNGNGYGINGQTTWGSAIGAGKGAQSCIIQNCRVYDNRGEGINDFGTPNCTIQDNVVYDNGALGIYIGSTSGTIVRRNLVYCSAGARYSPSRGIVISSEGGPDPANFTIINNLCFGNRMNLVCDSDVTEARGWLIANNSFVNVQKTQTQIDAGDNMNIYFYPTLVGFYDSVFKNNIILEEDNRVVPINTTLASSHAGFTFSNNCWNKTPTPAAQGPGDVIGNPLLARTGSTGAGSLSPAWFKILGNSPAKDKAEALSAVKEDFFRTPRGSAPDIGAHEFVTTGSATADLNIGAQTGSPALGLGGTTDPSPGTYSYAAGSPAAIQALANADYRFSRWTGDIAAAAAFNPANTLIMDATKSLSATFCVKCGDINGDLQITPGDAQLAFDIYLGKIASPTWCQLENADVNSDGTRLSPKVTPADAQSIFLHYLNKQVIAGDCSGGIRSEGASTQSMGQAGIRLTINEIVFAAGQIIQVPVIIDSGSDIRAFGFDLAFPGDQLTFIGLERTELTEGFDQLAAAVIPQATPDRNLEAGLADGDRILRVGGYKTEFSQGLSSGVLVALIFRAAGVSWDPVPLSIIAAYDDLRSASIRTDVVPGRVRRPQPAGPADDSSPRRRS